MPGQQRSSRTFTSSAVALLALAAVVISTAAAKVDAAAFDSPYVMLRENGTLQVLSVEQEGSELMRRARDARVGDEIDIPAVGAVPSFRVTLRKPAQVEPDERKTPSVAPLFVVADSHGEYEILVLLLQKHGVVGPTMDWSFRRGHLVVLGDIFDRGPNHTEILWLLYHLEAQARRAGGGVHLVLGNHETMVMSGDLRYANPKYARTAQALGVASYAELVAPDTMLGQWLRSKPVVLKINDLLCLHGGISPDVVDRELSLQRINLLARNALNNIATTTEADHEQTKFVLGRLGPQWYRGYFPSQADSPAATPEDIERIRAQFGISTILVGHTQVETVTPLYGGKVIAVQVYPRRDPNGVAVMEGVRIERNRYLRARIDGRTEALN